MKIFTVVFNYPSYNKQAENPLYNNSCPVVLTLADSALLKDGKPLFMPDDLGPIDYEPQLVVRINRLGKSIPERFAHRYYDAVTCGVGFTARQLLTTLRQRQLPWTMAKSFDGAAVIGRWVDIREVSDTAAIGFRLDVNGTTAYSGSSRGMLHGIDATVAYISRWFTLRTGDILFTGAPCPPAEAQVNDHLVGYVDDKKVLEFNVK